MEQLVAIRFSFQEEIHRSASHAIRDVGHILDTKGELLRLTDLIEHNIDEVFLIEQCQVMKTWVAMKISRADKIFDTLSANENLSEKI